MEPEEVREFLEKIQELKKSLIAPKEPKFEPVRLLTDEEKASWKGLTGLADLIMKNIKLHESMKNNFWSGMEIKTGFLDGGMKVENDILYRELSEDEINPKVREG